MELHPPHTHTKDRNKGHAQTIPLPFGGLTPKWVVLVLLGSTKVTWQEPGRPGFPQKRLLDFSLSLSLSLYMAYLSSSLLFLFFFSIKIVVTFNGAIAFISPCIYFTIVLGWLRFWEKS